MPPKGRPGFTTMSACVSRTRQETQLTQVKLREVTTYITNLDVEVVLVHHFLIQFRLGCLAQSVLRFECCLSQLKRPAHNAET